MCDHSPVFIYSGYLKVAVLVIAFLLAVTLAFQLLEINMDFKLGSMCELVFRLKL